MILRTGERQFVDGATEHCTACYKHISRHYGGVEYRCDPRDDGDPRHAQSDPARVAAMPEYQELARILDEALQQAQSGKGHERHGAGHGSFEDQRIVQINEQLGSNHGALYQACKKAQESAGLPYERGRVDLLGAINYIAAAVLILDRKNRKA